MRTDPAELATFREQVRRVLEDDLLPRNVNRSTLERLPKEAWLIAGENGLLCRTLPAAYGGHGDSLASAAVIIEEIIRLRLHLASFYLHSDIAVPYLSRFGTPAQRQRYLPECATGREVAALALTEPHTGSNIEGTCTTGTRVGNHYVVRGLKTTISLGMSASLLIVSVNHPERAGLSILLVDAASTGIERHQQPKRGLNGLDIAQLRFDDCHVPVANRLGAEGMGLAYIVAMLTVERLVLAIAAQAQCEDVLGRALNECQVSRSSGGPIRRFQSVRFTIAELVAECAVNKSFIERCVTEYDATGRLHAQTSAIAKLRATETLKKIALASVQLHGASGVLSAADGGSPADDVLDACCQTIWGGTSEVLKEAIASDLSQWAR